MPVGLEIKCNGNRIRLCQPHIYIKTLGNISNTKTLLKRTTETVARIYKESQKKKLSEPTDFFKGRYLLHTVRFSKLN